MILSSFVLKCELERVNKSPIVGYNINQKNKSYKFKESPFSPSTIDSLLIFTSCSKIRQFIFAFWLFASDFLIFHRKFFARPLTFLARTD